MGLVTKESQTPVNCAIYTRVSTTEGLDQEFTSIDNQRESAENYIKSQKSEGWVAIADRYDDRGYSGADINRPALEQLISDIKAGKINCLVVYKVDRLSRSLLDFSRLLELFEEYKVAFVSVTQAFNTNTSMGRLTLNILLSFAQFEREIISERTRDKMGAAKMKGKWIGGHPPLGYDLDRKNHILIKNPAEADLVNEIFALYLEKRSLLAVVCALNEKGRKTKESITLDGKKYGGSPFKLSSVQLILKNTFYIGKVSYCGKIYAGQQERIIPDEIFQKAQEILAQNRNKRRVADDTKHAGLLTKLLRCKACDHAMLYSYSRRDKYSYYYYICTGAQKMGYGSCPTRSIAAQTMELKFLACLRQISKHEKLRDDVWPSLALQEQIALVQSLVKQIDYDAHNGIMAITLNDNCGSCHDFSVKIDEIKRIPPHKQNAEIGKVPAVRQSLILAHHIDRITIEKSCGMRDISKWTGIAHPRICQIVNMLTLSPSIQEEILFSDDQRLHKVPEYKLRRITAEVDWAKQKELWNGLLRSS